MLNPNLGEDLLIEKELGAGPFGVVYSAKQKFLGRYAAVKIFHHHLTHKYRLVERLTAQGMLGGGLSHPGLVRLYTGSAKRDFAWVAMELVEGESLKTRIESAGVSFGSGELISWMIELCDILAELHHQKIFHHDIKPSNIFLTKEHLKLSDTGTASLFLGSAEGSSLVGNPSCCAPELWERPSLADGRADIYALGVVLYWAIAKRWPWVVERESEWRKKHCEVAPFPLEHKTELEQVVMKAIAKEPEARYQNVLELRLALESLLGVMPVMVKAPIPRWQKAGASKMPATDKIASPTPFSEARKEPAPATTVLPRTGIYFEFPNGSFQHLQGKEEYSIGRADLPKHWLPDIDLTPHGGESHGVGRHHAIIFWGKDFWKKDCVYLQDLETTNGTFINGKLLEDKEPVALSSGAQVSFGELSVLIKIFKK
jgi:serine/threonine protein kinase